MLKLLSLILFAITFATPGIAGHVKYQMNCDLGKGATQTQRANGYTVILTPSDGVCRVSVLDANKKPVFEYGSTGMQVFVGVGATTDGSPNAIIQADTFHPYKLFIVSLGEHPRLLWTIENLYGFWLQDDCGGKIRIWTSDGSFQQDPDLANVYHNDLFTPEIVFELREQQLMDATPECREYFDKEIKFYRSRLTKIDVEWFRSNQIRDEFHRGQVKGYILKIVFDYLYTSRETEAKEALQRMWPSNDSDRLWQSIVKLRSEGVLSNLAQAH